MESAWRIDLFGGLSATHGERVVTRFRTQKTAALLAYLAYHLRPVSYTHLTLPTICSV